MTLVVVMMVVALDMGSWAVRTSHSTATLSLQGECRATLPEPVEYTSSIPGCDTREALQSSNLRSSPYPSLDDVSPWIYVGCSRWLERTLRGVQESKFRRSPPTLVVTVLPGGGNDIYTAVKRSGGHDCLLKTSPQCYFWFRIHCTLNPRVFPSQQQDRLMARPTSMANAYRSEDYPTSTTSTSMSPAHYNVLVDENNFIPSPDGLVAPGLTSRAEARVVHEKDLETDHIHWTRFELSPFSRHLPGLFSFRTPANSTLFYTSTSPTFSDSITNTLLPQHTKLYVHACTRAKNHYGP